MKGNGRVRGDGLTQEYKKSKITYNVCDGTEVDVILYTVHNSSYHYGDTEGYAMLYIV